MLIESICITIQLHWYNRSKTIKSLWLCVFYSSQSLQGSRIFDQIRFPEVKISRLLNSILKHLALPCITCRLNFSAEMLKCEAKYLLCLLHLYLNLNDGFTALQGAQSLSTPCCLLWWWVRVMELLKFPTPPQAQVHAHTHTHTMIKE